MPLRVRPKGSPLSGFVLRAFSLIELLVVVAIIGILAAVGVVGYQVYIDSTRDEVANEISEFINRSLRNDVVSVENNLNARSELSAGVELDSFCYNTVNAYVTTLNGTSHTASDARSNPFNRDKGAACNGVWTASQQADTTLDNNSFTLPRGATIIYCDGLDDNAYAANLKENFNIRTCTCQHEDGCTIAEQDTTPGQGGSTGYRCVFEITGTYVSGGTLTMERASFSDPLCLDQHDVLYVGGGGGEAVIHNYFFMDQASGGGSVCSTTDNSTFTCGAGDTVFSGPSLADGTVLYTDEPGRCYYPFGEAINLPYSNYDRHTC